jgi:hypothetical protein
VTELCRHQDFADGRTLLVRKAKPNADARAIPIPGNAGTRKVLHAPEKC